MKGATGSVGPYPNESPPWNRSAGACTKATVELPNEWLEFLSLLQRHDAKFVIVGAYAMAVHGRPRATQDIDVFIEPSEQNAGRVARAIRDFGYPELAKESVEAFSKPPRMASLGVPPLRIDIMNHIDGVPFAQAYAGALREHLGGLELRFLGLRDFVETKNASGRTKDLLDIELLRESGLLDEE